MDSAELKFLSEKCASKVRKAAAVLVSADLRDCDEKLQRLRQITVDYARLAERAPLHSTVANQFENTPSNMSENDLDTDVKKFKEIIEELYNKQNTSTTHPYIQQFNNIVSAHDDSLNNSDIITTQSSQQYIDPITKQPIKIPVKNKICGHVYEESSIKELIKKNSRLKCPMVGCGNRKPIIVGDIPVDKILLTQLSETQAT